MIDINRWVGRYTDAVKERFGRRVWLIGLQGSYGRGEAAEMSDIDAVLILDTVSYEDLAAYSELLDSLPDRDKVCGFISGKPELEAWEKSDLFQFCHDTVPVYGSLDGLLRTIGENDVKRAVKAGACNLYHACAHNAVHEKSRDLLKELYKSAAFTLQAIAYLQTGVFERKQEKLSALLSPDEQKILEKRLLVKERGIVSDDEFAQLSALLIRWSSKWILKW